MEFVGKAIFLGPTLMEFVGKAISDQPYWNSWARPFRTKFIGIRGQGHFGPTLMEFVGKAIFSRTNLNGIRGQGHFGPFRP